MRLYFAGALGRNDDRAASEIGVRQSGVANRLLSYADEGGGSGKAAKAFWIRERERVLKLYLAGNVKDAAGLPPADPTDYGAGVRNRLLSYAFEDNWAQEAFKFWIYDRPAEVSVFLDCGAFSAMSQGVTIDLDKYCDYCTEHEPSLAVYAALDVIKDWRATQRNLDYMVAKGLTPMPTFHRGSPWEVLRDLAQAFPLIALGGMVGTGGKHDSLTEENVKPYLDECFRVLQPLWPVKVHLFGVVTQWILERYPFYSADSASAIMGAGMGRVLRWGGGRLRSRPWTEDVAEQWDGVVADGVGRIAVDGKGSASAHPGRRRRNIEAQLALERYLTELWVRRGVVWEEKQA